MIVYYTGTDNGDGSLGVSFFDSREAIEYLEEFDPETYRGEGGGQFECDNFSKKLRTLEDARQEYLEYQEWAE